MDETVSNNRDIRVAWHYHRGTKHPDGRLFNRWHVFSPALRPTPFKEYENLESIPLTLATQTVAVTALSAISTDMSISGEERIPDVSALTKILFYSAGITKRITYPGLGEMAFRAAACTGALYHIELYVVCGDLPGLDAGVYHFDPKELALKQLREGDYRGYLVDASGNEPAIAQAPLVIAYTDIFWRNACKYQAREYRHAFWDSGTILSQTLAVASAHGLTASIVAGFVDDSVNQLLGLDTEREVTLALVPIGTLKDATAGKGADVPALSLESGPIFDREVDFPAIREMHDASSLPNEEAVIAWRGQTTHLANSTPSGQLIPLLPQDEAAISQDLLEQVIKRRGSTRRFSRESITFNQLSTILDRALQGVPADFLRSLGTTLNHVYLIANAVEGLEPGAYVLQREMQSLELLKKGNFRGDAGHLALGQDLAADASAAIFFLTDLETVLRTYGNRGYRVAQLEASVAAGRMYLAAYAQRLGATGLTFYDDAVTEFFSPDAKGNDGSKSVMFLIAVGRPARRRRS